MIKVPMRAEMMYWLQLQLPDIVLDGMLFGII